MKKRYIILIAASAVLLLFGGYALFASIQVKPAEIQEISLNKDTIKVGIISDLQLPDKRGDEEVYNNSFKNALELLKEQGVDVIINAGDFTDLGYKESYENYREIWQSVFKDGEVIVSNIMGNHDYWLGMFTDCWEIPFPGKMQKRFMKYTGEDSPWTHKVINGYHLIASSPSNGGMSDGAYSDKVLKWTEKQIQIALEQNPDKPVFVTTHLNPTGMAYDDNSEGIESLNELFKKYPQVISLSGHSHTPLTDEQVLYQGSYTALNTGCLSYVCPLGDVIADKSEFIEANPMLMIATLENDSVSIQRYSVNEKTVYADPWELTKSVKAGNFTCDEKSNAARISSPKWDKDFHFTSEYVKKTEEETAFNKISFTAASHSYAVKYYEMEFVDANGKTLEFERPDGTKKSVLTGSPDYALSLQNRSETVNFYFAASGEASYEQKIPAGEYTVKIFALDSFGAKSEMKSGTAVFEY